MTPIGVLELYGVAEGDSDLQQHHRFLVDPQMIKTEIDFRVQKPQQPAFQLFTELWRVFDRISFEREIAAENVTVDEVLKLLDYPAYFDLLSLPLPEGRDGILNSLAADEMITAGKGGTWSITNLGAVLFAKRLADFRSL